MSKEGEELAVLPPTDVCPSKSRWIYLYSQPEYICNSMSLSNHWLYQKKCKRGLSMPIDTSSQKRQLIMPNTCFWNKILKEWTASPCGASFSSLQSNLAQNQLWTMIRMKTHINYIFNTIYRLAMVTTSTHEPSAKSSWSWAIWLNEDLILANLDSIIELGW